MSPSDDKSGEGDIMSLDLGDGCIDLMTFEQILEMDEEDDSREFSSNIVFDFFDQAETTFEKMDKTLKDKPDDYLNSLSALGHFLKGSSATLGLIKVKNSCEYIQNLGLLKDENGTDDISEDEAEKKIKKYIAQVKKDFDEVRKLLEKFYATTPN